MKVHLVRPRELSGDLVAAWEEILRDEPALDSPYFRPEFVQAVASVRTDVEIGVLEDGNRAVGFFPFQRGRWRVARPVGGRLSDFQAIIARSETPWSVPELLRGCRLSAWEFDHLLACQARLKPFHAVVADSAYVDFSQGFDAYKRQRRTANSDGVAQALRKHRKIEREVGPTRFVAHSEDESVLDQLLAWKSAQYRLTDLTDVFQYPWTVALIKRIWRTQFPGWSGMLSAIYVNDELLAVHFGMRTPSVLHWWFPAYNRAHEKYSPGLI
ncbi:MAG: GNAT family N-acetyltransferase, partial [Candidatus Rokuibacteriota bacterium]